MWKTMHSRMQQIRTPGTTRERMQRMTRTRLTTLPIPRRQQSEPTRLIERYPAEHFARAQLSDGVPETSGQPKMRWKGSEMRKLLLVGIAVIGLTASATFAQTTTPPPTASSPVAGKMTPKTAPKTTMPTKPRTADCSNAPSRRMQMVCTVSQGGRSAQSVRKI